MTGSPENTDQGENYSKPSGIALLVPNNSAKQLVVVSESFPVNTKRPSVDSRVPQRRYQPAARGARVQCFKCNLELGKSCPKGLNPGTGNRTLLSYPQHWA